MGQRHQIYLVYNDGRNQVRTIGIHHQWLFGLRALTQLCNFFKYVANYDQGYFEYSIEESFPAVYSVDIENGYFHKVHPLKEETKVKGYTEYFDGPCTIDPRLGDNNNGITIIDVRDRLKPKYCFMAVNGLECLHETSKQPKKLTPLSAETYIRLHYPKTLEDKAFLSQIGVALYNLQNYAVLTLDEVKAIFPAMYKKERSYDKVFSELESAMGKKE